jgi:hypothetical protein
MSPDERWFPSHLREIDQAKCLDLLAAQQVGRVAYCADLGHKQSADDWKVIHNGHLLDRDPSLAEIVTAADGEQVERTAIGEPWIRAPLEE